MRIFVNNWRLQGWESKELVLVLQHSNRRLAEFVQKYANDMPVKAVVARDGEFPSTAAFRFGAWTTKADIIARWDFEEWHHPERLTLQVKALAMTSRPASLLQPKGTHGINASDREATLIGEAKWMREEWYPFLKHGSDILEEERTHHIVQVDVPKLDINAEDTSAAPFKNNSAEGDTICRSLGEPVQNLTFEAKGRELPMPELMGEFEHLAVTGHEVDARLGGLCAQADTEADPAKRAEIHQRVAHLYSFEVAIANELNDPQGEQLLAD